MSNKEREWYPNTTHHVTIRGNRRNDIFRDEEDFEVYLTQLEGNIDYYNNEYEILYEKRYFSEIIEDDSQMLETGRYIHLNPLRANVN